MAANEIHIGDIGTSIQATIQDGAQIVDLSSATTQKYIVKKPDETCVEWTTSFVTDGTDGKIEYVTQTEDLDQAGEHEVQFYVEMPGGQWTSEIGSFIVYPNLECD